MDIHFLKFLESLETSSNKELLESMKSGFGALIESAGALGVRVGGYNSYTERESALDRYNGNAANLSSAGGNDLLNILRESEKRLRSKYSHDTEPELDGNPTSQFYRELNKVKSIPKEYKEDDLGFGIDEV
jgi:hypothetical protein